MRSVLTLLLLCKVLCQTTSENWCERKCGDDEQHLRCEHKLLSNNRRCYKIQVGLSPNDRMRILDGHNRWRDYVASGLGRINETASEFWLFLPNNPETLVSNNSVNQSDRGDYFLWRDEEGQAADMRQLVWDYELERNAAIWVSQCKAEATVPYHCAGTLEFEEVHMNLEVSRRSFLTPMSTLDSFLRKISYVDNHYYGDRLAVVRSYQAGIWDPFYAMIYSQTYAIGCSRGLCHCGQDPLPFGKSPGVVACLYGPSYDHTSSGFKIYEVDKTHCSKCPNGTSCRPDAPYKYLCARPGDPKEIIPIKDGFSKGHAIRPGTDILVLCALVLLRSNHDLKVKP